jgi:colicin import membrane protein
LQPNPNKALPGYPSEKKKGILGTVLIHAVILALLLLAGFTIPPPPEPVEEVLVNFGTDETGFGLIEPSPPAGQVETFGPAEQEEASPVTVPEPAVTTEEKPVVTQTIEEAPGVKETNAEAEKNKLEKIEADRIAKEQLEAERILKEKAEIEKKRIEAEQQRQTDIMNRTKNALANSRNAGTSSTSEGIAGGAGNQGVITGSVDSKVRGEGSGLAAKGISYDLQGRGFQALPPPKYDYQGEGRVVVEVSVDRLGNVFQAVPGTKGSTTLDEYLLRVAKEAALKAHFEIKSDAPPVQKGTITYNFVLK